MKNRQEIEAMLADTSPHDGFHVKEVVVGGEHSLYIMLYRDGVPVDPPWRIGPVGEESCGQLVWRTCNPTDKDYGEKARLRLLLDALCRFVNTGGDWLQLHSTLDQLWRMCQGTIKLDIPGFHLIDSALTTEGTFEHLYAADDNPNGVRWVEGQFFDVVPLTELKRQAEEDDDGPAPDPRRGNDPDDGEARLRLPGPETPGPAA